jgi:hypothetical protein
MKRLRQSPAWDAIAFLASVLIPVMLFVWLFLLGATKP